MNIFVDKYTTAPLRWLQVMKYTTKKGEDMSEAKDTKQMSIYMTPEVKQAVDDLKKVYYNMTYGELLRMMLLAGAEKIRADAGKASG